MACNKTELTRGEVAKKLYAELVCEADWLVSTHGLHLSEDRETGACIVTRYYEVPLSYWPSGGSPYDDSRDYRTHTITHSLTIPLRDYWRLGLKGKGV